MPIPQSRQLPNVLSHWYVLLYGFQFSTEEFYQEIEKELKARDVPGLTGSRVEYHEGGALSDKRVYLRLARERTAFDVCAAPFGKSYFFSLRFVETPRYSLVAVILMLVALGLIGTLCVRYPGAAIIALMCVLVGAAFILRLQNKAPSSGLEPSPPPESFGEFSLHAFVLNLPIVGEAYERGLKDTYHRHDTRLMYHTLVSDVVKKKVEEVTAAKGVRLIRSYEYSPMLGDIYKPATVTVDAARQPDP